MNMREAWEKRRRTERKGEKTKRMKCNIHLVQQRLRVGGRRGGGQREAGLNVLRESALAGWRALIGSRHERILTLYCYSCLQPPQLTGQTRSSCCSWLELPFSFLLSGAFSTAADRVLAAMVHCHQHVTIWKMQLDQVVARCCSICERSCVCVCVRVCVWVWVCLYLSVCSVLVLCLTVCCKVRRLRTMLWRSELA